MNPGQICRLPDGEDDRVAIDRLLAPFDELRVEAPVLVEYPAALNQLDAGNFAIAAENAFGAEPRVEPNPFFFRFFDLLARRRNFVEVLQTIHVDFRHTLANGFARHVQGES